MDGHAVLDRACGDGCRGRKIPASLPEAARAILARLHSDLIDDEDVREAWLTTLADAPNDAPARDEIRRLRDAALAQVDGAAWREPACAADVDGEAAR